MGKYVCFLAVCVVMLSSCYNDDDLKNSISGLEDRMDKLEASLQSVQTDISTLKTLTDALSQNKSIASVLENEDGSYTIKFSDKPEVTILNGENGGIIKGEVCLIKYKKENYTITIRNSNRDKGNTIVGNGNF